LETEEAIVNSEILRINPKNLVPQQSKEQMNRSLVKRLEAEMRTHGYDESQPISGVRREDGRIVISDGHHRRLAAIGAGIDQVPVEVHEHGLD
jgi:ParB-like chromosome segregation protein Spo0J